MKKELQAIKNNLNRNIYTGDRLEKNLRNIRVTAAIIVVMGVVMGLLNILQKQYTIAISPLCIMAAGIVSYISVARYKRREVAIAAMTAAVIVVLTYDVLFADNGFAFLWTLLVPLSVSYMFSTKMGMLITVYFQALFMVVFYTPVRQFVASRYTEIIMSRFPLLFFFHGIITLFVMYQYHRSVLFEIEHTDILNAEVARQTRVANERADQLERLSDQMVLSLARTIDAKDRYTNGHSFRVRDYAVALARGLGWTEEEIRQIRREALLHDIGKIGVPDAVLNKPGKLSAEEFEIIKSHTTVGGSILSDLGEMTGIASVAVHHHERYDGHGYPYGLSGGDIPPHARVVAVADAYDAMNSSRVYRDALSSDAIRQELIHRRGSQFDPKYVDVFLRLLDTGTIIVEKQENR